MSPQQFKERAVHESTGTPWFVELSPIRFLEMRGSDALDLLQRISTNDLSKLTVGSWMQTALTNEKGRMIDVLWVGRIQNDLLYLLSGTDSPEKTSAWIQKFIIMENVQISGSTDRYCRFVLEVEGNVRLTGPSFLFREEWRATRLLHLLVSESSREGMIKSLTEQNIQGKSGDEYEAYRISSGIPSGGHEITPDYNPLEAGMEHLISWTKGCYIGQEVIARLDTYKKVQRHLVKLILSQSAPTLPVPILGPSGEVGTVTSATSKPPYAGLGYLSTKQIESKEGLFLKSGNNQIQVMMKE